jgi:hypothetical protein
MPLSFRAILAADFVALALMMSGHVVFGGFSTPSGSLMIKVGFVIMVASAVALVCVAFVKSALKMLSRAD